MAASLEDINAQLAEEKNLVLQAAKNVSQNPEIWISVSSYLYQKVQKRRPLEAKDQNRYHEMCKLYKTNTENGAVPREWELDADTCPAYYSDFVLNKKRLDHELGSHNGLNEHESITFGILGCIDTLLNTLSKSSNLLGKKIHRLDGIESMFLSELAMWLVIELPRYSMTDPKTAQIVKGRIRYYQLMCLNVNDADVSEALSYILHELKVVHKALVQEQHVAAFREQSRNLRDEISDMVIGTFNILYLMLNEGDQYGFCVRDFIRLGNSMLKKSLLVQWLEQTCNVAGIENNMYLNTKNIPIEILDNHLSTDFSIKDITDIGFHDFVWRTNDSRFYGPSEQTQAKAYLRDNASSFLNLIINLHRSILKFIYIRDKLKNTTESQIFFGSLGTKEGTVELNNLMQAIEHTNNNYINALEQFWDVFFTKTYEPYARGKDSTCLINEKMRNALNFYLNIRGNSENITSLASQISRVVQPTSSSRASATSSSFFHSSSAAPAEGSDAQPRAGVVVI